MIFYHCSSIILLGGADGLRDIVPSSAPAPTKSYWSRVTLKVHAFKVETARNSSPLAGILQRILDETALRNRIKTINTIDMRADAVENRAGIWLMDFVRFRGDHGPGKVGRDSEIEGFDFQPGESFGEETAALYDPGNEYILIQYNHFGIRAGAISDYLSIFFDNEENSYTFKPKYDPEVEAKLRRQRIDRRLEFAIDMSRLSAHDRELGTPLRQALGFGREAGADHIEVVVSVKGEGTRSLARTSRGILDRLKNLQVRNADALSKLKVAGKENSDSVMETLDLIAQRLLFQYGVMPGPDLRYPREARWSVLERARSHWRGVLRP